MRKHAPVASTEWMYHDLEQTTKAFERKKQKPILDRLINTVCSLIEKLSGNELIELEQEEMALRMAPHCATIIKAKSSFPNLFDKYSERLGKAVSILKNSSVNKHIQLNDELDQFTKLFVQTSPSPGTLTSAIGWRAIHCRSDICAPVTTREYPITADIWDLLYALYQPPGDHNPYERRDNEKYLMRMRNDEPTYSFVDNFQLLNIIQKHLTRPVNGSDLHALLNKKYGNKHYSAIQREIIAGKWKTLYPYLRFAMLGSVKGNTNTALVTSDFEEGESALQADPELLEAVLNERMTQHFGSPTYPQDSEKKIAPKVLVDALIGGETTHFEYSASNDSYSVRGHLRPLIFHFATSKTHMQLLLKNILFVKFVEFFGFYGYTKTQACQLDNVPELIRLTTYMRDHAVNEEQKKHTKACIKQAISQLPMTEASLKIKDELQEIYESVTVLTITQPDGEQILAIMPPPVTGSVVEETTAFEALKQTTSSKHSPLQASFFQPAANTSTERSQLLNEIITKVAALRIKLEKEPQKNDLHIQKIEVLIAAQHLLKGYMSHSDFEAIKIKNSRYAEAFFSSEVEKLVDKAAKLAPTNPNEEEQQFQQQNKK
jgi:hypothetical protein